VAATCSRVLIISKGKIAADGRPDELQRKAQGQMSLQVELVGDAQMAKSGLESISAVESVRALSAEEDDKADGHRFVVMAKTGSDPRAEIFKMATQKGLQLLELHRERASLEDVFRNLTSGGSAS